MSNSVEMPYIFPNDYGIRPAGAQNRCFYCHSFIGEQHKPDCVCIVKKINVLVKFEIDGERFVLAWQTTAPWAWERDSIEFKYNEGTWCCSNFLNYIEDDSVQVIEGSKTKNEIKERLSDKEKYGCLCGILKFGLESVLDDTPRINS